MSDERRLRLFTELYLLSFAVLVGWLVLVLIGIVQPEVMAFANKIALPTILGSIASLELFRWLARRADKKLLPSDSNG